MTGSTLDEVPSHARIFVDASVFLYHFSQSSEQCRRFLRRCELRECVGLTSVATVLEVTHRLMAMEAVAKGLVSAGRAIRRLRERPDLVKGLTAYSKQVAEIPQWGIGVQPIDIGLCLRAADVRAEHGLLTNDALILATMGDAGVAAIATADMDFARVEGLRVYRPTDLGSARPALA